MVNDTSKQFAHIGLALSFAVALASIIVLAMSIGETVVRGLPQGRHLLESLIGFAVFTLFACVGLLGTYRFALLSAYALAFRPLAGLAPQDSSSTRPELRQFGTLARADFERQPVWSSVHVLDYGQPWYEETDEETFRPWLGQLPVHPQWDMFLVRAHFRLKDGTKLVGFITPAPGLGRALDYDLGIVQPHIFLPDGRMIAFWQGIAGFSEDYKQAAYKDLGKHPDDVFPIRFAADRGLCVGKHAGRIYGFVGPIRGKRTRIEFTR